ncbi:MAG: protein-ADP-ribose hydrolase [Eggerthellaceae bacterium]|nr:protein-ADP-ribose hydrolase [Eggerthellaceae bacterium]
MDAERKAELLARLVRLLEEERGGSACDVVATDDAWLQFRALVNVRPPWPASEEFLAAQDELLQGLIAEAGVHDIDEAVPSPADPRLRLWRGDITTLAADAIVNAANSQMLGCWAPLHYCIDNAIHTFAGVQLRIECARLMAEQGHDEPTGQAKITSAYNLPAKRVIHTVGPIANGSPTDEHCAQLASCYESCLDAAAAEGLRSIAFCCISTGVFGFPQREAAGIAVRTVRAWLDAHGSDMAVVFNVFGESDERIYRGILGDPLSD